MLLNSCRNERRTVAIVAHLFRSGVALHLVIESKNDKQFAMEEANNALVAHNDVSKGARFGGKTERNNGYELASLTTKAQGATQEFNIVMQAATNIIKTVGQAADQAVTK